MEFVFLKNVRLVTSVKFLSSFEKSSSVSEDSCSVDIGKENGKL